MSDYAPFRNIETLGDLQLVSREIKRGPVNVKVPQKNVYYSEVCVWVTVEADEAALFSADGQTLIDGKKEDGGSWRLSVTKRGYLRFECGDGDDALSRDSKVPIHSIVGGKKQFRVGFMLLNFGWALRDTHYAKEASSYCRLRFIASPDAKSPFSVIGGYAGPMSSEISPVPDSMTVGANSDKSARFAGSIIGVELYNCGRPEVYTQVRGRDASAVCPVIPGGGGFMAHWVDEQTVDVCTRPEFSQTASYWVYLRLADSKDRLRRLRVHTLGNGGANMTPTFFCSPDGEKWRRIVPEAIVMGDDGQDFTVDFRLTKKQAAGCYIASSPPFGEKEKGELLAWAATQPHTEVFEIGASAEGRPIHLIRLASGDDGAEKKGVAVVCGQHSPLEIMGGLVIRPAIEAILRKPELLEACNFYFVPTVNVDCAHYGGNGLNANRRNNNRHWFTDIQPENAAVIDYFNALREKGQGFEFALDIHAGGIFRNHLFMRMGNSDVFTLSDEAIAEQEIWLDLLEKHAGLRRDDGTTLAQLRLRANDYFHQVHGCVAFCLELSTCSYFDPNEGVSKVFGTDAFEILGDGLAAAWAERFC